MLKEIYITFGGVGAFFIAIAMCLVALSWWLAITGTVMRSMVQWKKASLLFLLSVAPPASIGVLIAFLINDRKLATIAATARAKNIGFPKGR
ncbi:hypothetical protein HQ496_11750 [bacterium]|nr:hypothetical protein [bacterium]